MYHDRLTPQGVKNVTYIFGVPLCRVSEPWVYTTYIYIYVGCFTQIQKVNVKMLHYIFRLGKDKPQKCMFHVLGGLNRKSQDPTSQPEKCMLHFWGV